MQFLAIVVRAGFFDLCADLVDPPVDVLLLAGAVDNGRVVLIDGHALGGAQHVDGNILELYPEIFRNNLTTRQDSDVLQHRLPTIAEARRLDGRDLQAATQAVDDQRRERFAFDILGEDKKRATALNDSFQQWQHRLQAGELRLMDQNVGILEFGDHFFRVSDKVR